jgi:glycosyltransferase involved in cell wall biosynthesis
MIQIRLAGMANRIPQVLLIGPLPPPVGGTRVSFRHLADLLSRQPELAIRVLELRPLRRNPLRSLFSVISLLARCLWEIPRTDLVSLHCNPSALPLLGVAVALLAKAAGKPLMVRTFGGVSFLHEYIGIRRALARWVLARANVYLAQTKAQLAMAREHGLERVRWFPTSRPALRPAASPSYVGNCRRFVFCSHIKPDKGIRELIAAAEQLDIGIVVDVYGPFRDGMTEDVFENCRIVKYGGDLRPERVVAKLSEYDALVLPTYFEGEGYPGVIIEAYLAGLPVISTRWRTIPELVDGDVGILVEPRDANALLAAMRSLIDDASLFHHLQAGTAAAAARYSLDFWVSRFVEYCHALLGTKELPLDPDLDRAPMGSGYMHRQR